VIGDHLCSRNNTLAERHGVIVSEIHYAKRLNSSSLGLTVRRARIYQRAIKIKESSRKSRVSHGVHYRHD